MTLYTIAICVCRSANGCTFESPYPASKMMFNGTNVSSSSSVPVLIAASSDDQNTRRKVVAVPAIVPACPYVADAGAVFVESCAVGVTVVGAVKPGDPEK